MGVYFRDVLYPRFCTECGKELHRDYDEYTKTDWNAKVSHRCHCGMQYIKADIDDLGDEVKRELTYWDNRS